MATEITTLKMFKNIKNIDFGEKCVFFKFGGQWCKACKDLDKNIECIPDVVIYEINVENDEFESFLIENNVYSIPDTMITYKSNEVRFQGVRTPDELNEMITSIKGN